MKHLVIPAVLFALAFLSTRAGAPEDPPDGAAATAVGVPPAVAPNRHYPSNRPPLTVNPLVKLPIGTIEPRGWLMAQLRLMRDGFTGRLAEISRFLGDDSGWITMKGKGWEEMPYWLKGYGDLGYLLKDAAVRKETERWLGYAFRSQARDGYFGPADNRAALDLWPNMVMLAALQSYHEATGDRRVLDLMSRYFQFELHLPEDQLLPGSWQKLRGGENLESVYWLYNRTGEGFLLDLARKINARTADWASPILSAERDAHWEESSFYHGVNIAMGFRYPGLFFQQTRDAGLLETVERNYRQVMDRYGRQPGGMFGADENIRPGHEDPRQGAETCTMVEFMASFESLLKITGGTVWADRAEEVAFNSLPASMTPDLKGLHYLTAANLISCDSGGEHDFQNTGTLVSFDPWSYRCCQHNVAFGWPWFAEHLWLATADNGLAAAIYAPSAVRAKVAEGAEVEISEETAYPFGDEILLTVACDRPVAFPLYLRLPGWARTVRIVLNGRPLEGDFRGGALRRPAPDLAARRPGAAGVRARDRGRPLAVRARRRLGPTRPALVRVADRRGVAEVRRHGRLAGRRGPADDALELRPRSGGRRRGERDPGRLPSASRLPAFRARRGADRPQGQGPARPGLASGGADGRVRSRPAPPRGRDRSKRSTSSPWAASG